MRTTLRSHTLAAPSSHMGLSGIVTNNKVVKPSKFQVEDQSPTYTSSTMHSAAMEGYSLGEFDTCSDETSTSLDSFLSLYSLDKGLGPGTLKTKSQNLTSLVQTTKTALLVHGINLEVELSGKQIQDVSNILNVLVSETALFPAGFFHKINFKRIVISCESEPKTAHDTISLRNDMLENEVKVAERLYKIIFDHLISVKPKMASDWKQLVNVENSSKEQWCLEEVFIALMRNRSNPVLKQLMNTLKGLLKAEFPGDLTEEWFEKRNITKKKMRRVSFST